MNHKVVRVIHEERKKIIQIFQKLMFANYDKRVVNFEKKRRSRINSGHEDLYGDEEHYFRATKLDFPEDATHFFVSALHPRVKEEDLETKFPHTLRVQLARDRPTRKSLRHDDGSIDGIDICRKLYEVSKDIDPKEPLGKSLLCY
ncbi:hypothetical protein Tco_1219688 [Tanacetum coccineum]